MWRLAADPMLLDHPHFPINGILVCSLPAQVKAQLKTKRRASEAADREEAPTLWPSLQRPGGAGAGEASDSGSEEDGKGQQWAGHGQHGMQGQGASGGDEDDMADVLHSSNDEEGVVGQDREGKQRGGKAGGRAAREGVKRQLEGEQGQAPSKKQKAIKQWAPEATLAEMQEAALARIASRR